MNLRIKHLLISLGCFFMFCINAQAQDAPALQHVFDINAELQGDWIDMGRTSSGVQRTIICISGGNVQGPGMNATIRSGGADYQLRDSVAGITRLHAVYTLRTDDGVDILVENDGLISGPQGEYFFTTPRFEAPCSSPYAWLNEAIFICRPVGFEPGSITLRVWKVVPQAL